MELKEEVDDFKHMELPIDYGGSLKILFVEDSDADIEVVRHTLAIERISNKIEHAYNAQEAWHYLQEKKYDWIFIDRNLDNAEMTGDQLIERVCQDKRFNKSKLIIISGSSLSEKDKIKFTELGVNVSFSKPLTVGEIDDMIKASENLWKSIYKRREPV